WSGRGSTGDAFPRGPVGSRASSDAACRGVAGDGRPGRLCRETGRRATSAGFGGRRMGCGAGFIAIPTKEGSLPGGVDG
ncbi:MAG: hypothetical protein AVDCRST_MAG19-3839, partial [uncultured Thermomicrobiales bacterium]